MGRAPDSAAEHALKFSFPLIKCGSPKLAFSHWILITMLPLFPAAAAVSGQIDRLCRAKCEVLVVRGGHVTYVDQWLNRTVVLGKYASSAQGLVSPIEGPVRDIKSARGWRIVLSAYLDHDQAELKTRLRIFGTDRKLRRTADALAGVQQVHVSGIGGATDELFALTSNWEHAYNAQTQIWLLPQQGEPKVLLEIQGYFSGFIGTKPVRGVIIARQTYDGVSAETKGTVQEAYRWNSASRSLTPDQAIMPTTKFASPIAAPVRR